MHLSMDYEKKQVYTFDVNGTEGNEGSISASIKIVNLIVLDVNDNDPWLSFSPEFSSTLQTMFSISDRAITGTVITKLTATDKDGDNIEYSLLEFQSSTMYQDGRPFFLVNSNTGNVTIQNQPDGSGPYLLTVVASDNGAEPRQSSPFYLVITVTSKFDRVILLHISESDAVGTRVSGVQCSENTTSVRVLDDSEVENIFDLSNIQSGYVELLTELDYEEKQVYTFDVECMERNEGPISASIKIAVLDVNDNDPWLSSSDAAQLFPQCSGKQSCWTGYWPCQFFRP